MIFTTLGTFNFRHFTILSTFVAVPDWIWFIFIFVFGCCVGSFLNVIVYRLPRDKSIITPSSACPSCGKHIHFYDNIPLISWIVLGRRCRYCKVPISPRYFIIELLTGVVFLALFILYFRTEMRDGIRPFLGGGWLIYLISVIMLSAFIAASAIDIELWVIPLSICWLVTIAGLLSSAIGGYIIHPSLVRAYLLLPIASAETGSLAIGALTGLVISWIFLATGLIKRSYETEDKGQKPVLSAAEGAEDKSEQKFNHRLEVCKEILFLLPIIICAGFALWLLSKRVWWVDFAQHPAMAGLLGSLWGYFVGCGIVWVIRILGTLALGKEAMGLGDVHLMGAAGAVIGPIFVVVAFFIAPFFGLAWAAAQMFFKKIRQIPYGPFLSLAIFTVMILHDWIVNYFKFIFDLNLTIGD